MKCGEFRCPSGTKPTDLRRCVIDPLAYEKPRDTASTLLYVGLDPWEFQQPGWKPVSQFFLNWEFHWACGTWGP